MTQPLTFQKLKIQTRPSFPGAHTVTSPFYSIHSPGRNLPYGWTGQNAEGEWLLWNAHGDFWISYAPTRTAALAALPTIAWHEFQRRQ